jgi:diphthine synthase
MFFLIGLGLCDESDITLRGLEIVKRCSRVYLEAYTSILMVNKEKLVSLGGYHLQQELKCLKAGVSLSKGSYCCRS